MKTTDKKIDAPSIMNYSISGEKLDKYCHVVNSVIDEVTSNWNDDDILLTKESLTELCSNDELSDVMNSFEVQSRLNNLFFNDEMKLNPRVRMRLLDIADKFYDDAETPWVKPKDIIFTGSLCNYSWGRYSDIDLHIVLDFKKVDERVNFVADYFDAKKNLWNEKHDNLTIYGFPVEIYVQDSNEEHVASGVYSLYNDDWIVEPNANRLTKYDIDKKKIASKVMSCADKIDKLENEYQNETDKKKIEEIGEEVKKIFAKIKNIRKNALKNGGEFSSGNIWYKSLRRLGYIKKILTMKEDIFDSVNSLS